MIAGDGPAPSLVLLMVQRLPDDCMTAALASGGREHFGWGTDRHLTATLVDAVHQVIRVAGNWKKKAPDIPPVPRPKAKKQLPPRSNAKPGESPLAAIHRALTGGR